ncbi:hypothetical protein BVY04_04205 [bacterium M21]|nr:hypothetical protein BVY04_04205 [bacterium M21]
MSILVNMGRSDIDSDECEWRLWLSYEVKCEYCGSKVVTEPQMINRTVPCGSCQEEFLVPLTNFSAGVVTGTYWIQRKVGTGNVSEIFLAKRLADNEKVYLKVLSPCVTPSKKLVEQFMIEMCRSHQIDHPNVISVFETGKMNGHYYLASKYIEGECLDNRIERTGPMTEKEALKLCLKVARVLRTCWHDFGIVHRSVRPSNILVSDGGEVFVLDVGNSKQLLINPPEVTLERLNNMGTLADFMSPEQAQNMVDLDCSSDIYSLGATLFYLLTGTKPYTGSDTTQVMLKHLNSDVPNPMKRPGEVSRETAQLIRAMMDTSPDGRIYSWREVVNRIKQLLKTRTHGSKTESALNTKFGQTPQFGIDEAALLQKQEKKKSPAIIFLSIIVAVILLVGIVGGIAIVSNNSERDDITMPDPPRGRLPRQRGTTPATPIGKRIDPTQLGKMVTTIGRGYERHPESYQKYSERMAKLLERTDDPEQIKIIKTGLKKMKEKKAKYDRMMKGEM